VASSPVPGSEEALPAARAPDAARAEDGAPRRQAWVTLFRLVTVTVLLGGTAAWHRSAGLREAETTAGRLYTVLLVVYALSLALAVWLRLRRGLAALAVAQVALDVGLATALVALTGWAESVFVFLFAIAVVTGSLLLYRRGALLAVALALAAYLPGAVLLAPVRPPPAALFAHAGALLATAALAGYLSEQLRRTGERLAAREVDLAEITALHEAIVQSVASGLFTLDARRRVTFLNRAGEEIIGRRLAEVLGRPADWFPELPARASRDELDFVNARGQRLRLGFTVFPLRARGGEEIGQAVIFQDLTALRAMEERVTRSERLAELSHVAAGLATSSKPLASMSGSVELLSGARRSATRIAGSSASCSGRQAPRPPGGAFPQYSRPEAPARGAPTSPG
jgi:two-component system sensor histidine kinase PilS (NtrC family)